MSLAQLRQAITRLILPTADLGLREQTVDPLLFPDDLSPILAINAGQSAAGPKLQVLGINGGIMPAVASEGNTINTGELGVGVAALQVVPANPNRFVLFLTNTSVTTIYIGNSGVTTLTGFAIIPNGSVVLRTGAAIYAIAGAGPSTFFWLEESA